VEAGAQLTDRIWLGRRECRKYCGDLYSERIDLRGMGLPGLLFLRCCYNSSHKLAFLQVGSKYMEQIFRIAEQVFLCDPLDLRIARIDLAVDLPGITLDWIRTHLRVSGKRMVHEIGSAGKCATVYFGRGQDLIRAYDKQAERRRRFIEDRKEGSQPAFNDEPQLVRIERQLRSGRVPFQISTLGKLQENALNFDPFSQVVIFAGGMAELDICKYSTRHYLEGVGLRTLVTSRGLAKTWSLISSQTGGNAKRVFDRLSDFLPPAPITFTRQDLLERYQTGIRKQVLQDDRF